MRSSGWSLDPDASTAARNRALSSGSEPYDGCSGSLAPKAEASANRRASLFDNCASKSCFLDESPVETTPTKRLMPPPLSCGDDPSCRRSSSGRRFGEFGDSGVEPPTVVHSSPVRSEHRIPRGLQAAQSPRGGSHCQSQRNDGNVHRSESGAPLLTPPRVARRHRRSYGTAAGDSRPLMEEEEEEEEEDGDLDDVEPRTNGKWTRRQARVLFVILFASCSSSLAVCLFPPFFPRLAEEKGATATIYGFVIGSNCLTSFLVTPVVGKNLPKVGVRYGFVWGMLMGGVCCALSGFLEFFPPDWKFVVTAVFIRIVHAVGNAMVITGTFTYSAMEFQSSVGTIFSFTRTAMNLAQLLGPLVGGAIYQAGGFYLPFLSMGASQFAMGVCSLLLLPEISPVTESPGSSRKSGGTKRVSIFNILSIPTIWFSFVTFIVATVCNGFLSINLEPRVLRRFNLTPFYVGLLFGLKDGANSISSPIWGFLCDKGRKTTVKPYVIMSAGLVASSFILMGAGSVVGLNIEKSIPLLVFTLCLNGIGIGGEQVAGVVDALHEAVAAGYTGDPALHGLIAGLWSSLSGAGRFVSRVGSGILVDCIGFNHTAAVVTSLQLLIALSTFVYMIAYECSLKKREGVQWQDVTVIEEDKDLENDVVVFTESGSPSESLMGKSVSIDVPKTWSNRYRRASKTYSLPPSAHLASAAEAQQSQPAAGQLTRHPVARSLLPNIY